MLDEEGSSHGVVRTDKWLEQHFYSPREICHLASPNSKGAVHFYRYLKRFGMYEPSAVTRRMFEQLKEQKAWEKVEKYYERYRKCWNGPNVKIYIFPLQPTNHFIHYFQGRSGVTFPNKIFLFLSPTSDRKNWESVFVHEYHHATRMCKYDKQFADYDLLDSLIFEGLAEHAVLKYCGKKYVSKWMTRYEKDELSYYWKQLYKRKIKITKKDPEHQLLLFGGKGIPMLMGYAIGAELIKSFKGKEQLTVQQSFTIPSETILNNNELNE